MGGVIHWLGKRRWKGALLGDRVVEVGTAYLVFLAPGMEHPVETRAAVVVGEERIALGLMDLRDLSVNTIVLAKAEIAAIAESGTGELRIQTSKGGEYLLTGITKYLPVVAALRALAPA